MGFSNKQRLGAILLALIFVFTLAAGALAHVDEDWEWTDDPETEKPRRHLRIHCGAGVTKQWQSWMEQAIKNWHDADTGWTFEIVDDKDEADIEFTVRSFGNNNLLGEFTAEFDSQTGRIVSGELEMNSDHDWGTSGDDNYNPVHMLKHELGHAMRLDHSDEGNLMQSHLGAGHHNPRPNEDDISQAKEGAQIPSDDEDTEDAQTDPADEDVRLITPAGELIALADDFELSPDLRLQPLAKIVMPRPLDVPEGMERVLAGIGVFPLPTAFSQLAELHIKVPPGAISGLELIGDLHEHPLPPVDPRLMVPVQYVQPADGGKGRWIELKTPLVWDPEKSVASFTIAGGGLYGVAAPAETLPAPQYVKSFTDLPAGVIGHTLVELRALDIYRGYPDGTAKPERNLSRLEFITVVLRARGEEDSSMNLSETEPPFADEIPAWGWGYVNRALELGMIEGYPDGTFRPFNDVTGNEAMAVLIRMFGPWEDTVARQKPWPTGYIESAERLGLYDVLAELDIDLPSWRTGAITRGEMAVVTSSALWTDLRHNMMGIVEPSISIMEEGGWWKQTVSIATTAASGRRWVSRHVLEVPQGYMVRMDVNSVVYRGLLQQAMVPQTVVTVLGQGQLIKALFD